MLVLVATNDLGSGLLYFGIFLAMLYIATARLSYVLGGIVLFGAGGIAAYEKIPHVHERVTIWLQPWTTQRSTARRPAASRSARTARATSS